jgi:hypothetical protein
MYSKLFIAITLTPFVFCGFASPTPPQSYTFTYNFNVPVALKELGPPGTQLYVQCWVTGSPNGGTGSTAFQLDATGSFNQTVPVTVQVQDVRRAMTYKCSIPQGNTPQGALFVVPRNLSTGVTGDIVTILPIQLRPK